MNGNNWRKRHAHNSSNQFILNIANSSISYVQKIYKKIYVMIKNFGLIKINWRPVFFCWFDVSWPCGNKYKVNIWSCMITCHAKSWYDSSNVWCPTTRLQLARIIAPRESFLQSLLVSSTGTHFVRTTDPKWKWFNCKIINHNFHHFYKQ